MIIKTEDELKALQESGKIVADCLRYMLDEVKPGISTKYLDELGGAYLTKYGAKSAPITMYDFPGYTCISLNEEAAHGIPRDDREILAGDLINIDVSAVKNDIYADTGSSMCLDPVNEAHKRLLKATRTALNRAISNVRAGEGLNIIGKTIEKEAKQSGYTVIRNLCSHGVGRTLHDEPSHIVSYRDPTEKRLLVENMVITIEPFLSTGSVNVTEAKDGWTLVNKRGCISAQFEHTMVVRKNKEPLIVTL